METTNIFINIGISVVSGAAGCGLFVWLGKKWIGNWFEKDLKKYEQQLDLLKMQKHLQFSNVYVQRAEVIRETYKLIARLSMADIAIKGVIFKNEDEKQKTFQEYRDELSQLYLYSIDNGIYLPQSTFNKLMALTNGIGKEIFSNIANSNIPLNDEAIKSIENIPDYDKAEISNELKSEFQSLLGIIEK